MRAELVGKRAEQVGWTTTFGSLEKAYVEYLGKWEDKNILGFKGSDWEILRLK